MQINDLTDLLNYHRPQQGAVNWNSAGVVISECKKLDEEHTTRLDKHIRMILFDRNENELCLLSEIPDVELPEGVEVIWRES